MGPDESLTLVCMLPFMDTPVFRKVESKQKKIADNFLKILMSIDQKLYIIYYIILLIIQRESTNPNNSTKQISHKDK